GGRMPYGLLPPTRSDSLGPAPFVSRSSREEEQGRPNGSSQRPRLALSRSHMNGGKTRGGVGAGRGWAIGLVWGAGGPASSMVKHGVTEDIDGFDPKNASTRLGAHVHRLVARYARWMRGACSRPIREAQRNQSGDGKARSA